MWGTRIVIIIQGGCVVGVAGGELNRKKGLKVINLNSKCAGRENVGKVTGYVYEGTNTQYWQVLHHEVVMQGETAEDSIRTD